MGLTFAQWHQQARLMHALEKVAERVPATTIAFDLGYGNVRAFIEICVAHSSRRRYNTAERHGDA